MHLIQIKVFPPLPIQNKETNKQTNKQTNKHDSNSMQLKKTQGREVSSVVYF